MIVCKQGGCLHPAVRCHEYCLEHLDAIKITEPKNADPRYPEKDTNATGRCQTLGCGQETLNVAKYCQTCLTAKTNPNAGGIMHGCKTPACFNIVPKGRDFCTMCQLTAQDKEQRALKAPKPFDWRKLHGRKMEVLVGVDIARDVDTQVITLYDPKTKEFFVISSRQKGTTQNDLN